MKKLIEKLAPLQKYLIVITFLGLEVFAFISFGFGNSYILFSVLSFALMVLLILFTIKEITVDGVAKVAILFIPLVLYVLLTAVGIYSKYHIFAGDFNVAEVVFVPIGLLSVALCGYLLSLNKTFKLKHFFIVIYSALGLLVFLNLLINLINFGFFYSVVYKGYYMYFGGLRSSIPVNEMAYSLEAFKFVEVRMDHYVLYPVLLLTSSIFLFFTKPKEEKKLFAAYLVFTILGVLALVFIPSLYGLLGALTVIVADLIVFFASRYPGFKKGMSYATVVALIMFAIVMFILFVINQDFGSALHAKFAASRILNRLFISNRFAHDFSPLITDLFKYSRFFGFYENHITEFVATEAHLSGSYIFDNLMTSGLIGGLAFFFILLMSLRGYRSYLFQKDDEEMRYKGMMFTFFASFFVYSMFFYNGEYGIFYSIYKPIYMTGPFMLALFMLFYVFSKINEPKKEEVVVNA